MPADGSDFTSGYVVPKETLNEIKNNHRGVTIPTALAPGAEFSKSSTNQLFHTTVTGTEGPEIWQGEVLCLNNEIMVLNNEVLFAPII